MATIKIKFRTSSSHAKEGTLFFQVIHQRLIRQIHTGYKLRPQEWDAENKEIVFPPYIGEKRQIELTALKKALAEDYKRLENIISHLQLANKAYSAENVVEKYLANINQSCLISFARQLIEQLSKIGKQCTADSYTTAINSFARFRKEQDISLCDVNSELMIAYETYLESIDICPNSISFYMRNLRAIYNRAVDKELTLQRYPFKHVYTGIDKTIKRAVSLNVIRQIRDLELKSNPEMDYSRDLFMFSFYTRGMSFVDMAFLKKNDLQNGILSYRRHKTNQQLFIKWEQPMQKLIDKYDTSGSPYLLPIIKIHSQDERKQYKSEAHRVNHYLKKIGKRLGLAIPLTTYVARHGWASIAQSKNIPIATISEAMGHDSESTTRIYLASLNTTVVDEANSLILDSL